MAKIIAVANQKGGVGKTTTAVNLAACLAATKRRILLIDFDAQGNATMGVGVDKDSVEHSTYEFLIDKEPLASVVQILPNLGLHLLAANSDLTAAEVELRNRIVGELTLKNALAPVLDDYDYIIIDCPPALSMLTLNALACADGVLIPMQCEYYALEGLSDLNETIRQIKGAINAKLEILGIVRTMYDPRNTLATEVSDQLTQHFGSKLYHSIIPRNVRLAEAPSHGLPILQYDPSSRGSQAYLALAGELLRREEPLKG